MPEARRKRRHYNTDHIFDEDVTTDPVPLRHWLKRVDGRFFGTPVDIHPHEAILQALRITAGEVAYCDAQIRKLTEDELFERPNQIVHVADGVGRWSTIERRHDSEEVSRWVRFRQQAVNNMAKYAKLALDAGVDEREIALAEKQAEQLDKFLRAVVNELDLSPRQVKQLGPAMRRQLELMQVNGGVVNSG